MVFGAVYYTNIDLRENPDRVTEAIGLLRFVLPGDRQCFQGMYATADKWSRRVRTTPRALKQLQVDVMGGVYSHINAYFGEADANQVVLTMDCSSNSGEGAFSNTIRLVGAVEALRGWRRAEQVSIELWDLFEPGYGLSVFGSSATEVQAELTGIPVVSVSDPLDPQEEARLFRIQDVRSQMGQRARDAAWGNFLGSKLASTLGGLQAIQQLAPASLVSALSGEGAYIRVTDGPCLLKSFRCEQHLAALREFIRPILVC